MKRIIFGLDLSLNSTGICMLFLNDMQPQYMSFYNLIFDDESRVNDWSPIQISNVTRETYTLPKNINPDSLVYEKHVAGEYDYNMIQMTATLKAMICVKRMFKIIHNAVDDYCVDDEPYELFFCVEGYLTPTFTTHRQMATISELTILQGLLRSEIIKYGLEKPNCKTYIETISPTVLKKFFTGNGKAEKKDMIHQFMTFWNGNRFIPETTKQKIDDVVDAFALMVKMRMLIYKKEHV